MESKVLRKLNARGRGRGRVQSGRRKHTRVLVYLERHDVRRILVGDVNEVTGWVEIEVPGRAALRVNPADYAQLSIRRIDRKDRDIIVAPVGGIQELTLPIHQDLTGAAISLESRRQGAYIQLARNQLAGNPLIAVDGVG